MVVEPWITSHGDILEEWHPSELSLGMICPLKRKSKRQLYSIGGVAKWNRVQIASCWNAFQFLIDPKKSNLTFLDLPKFGQHFCVFEPKFLIKMHSPTWITNTICTFSQFLHGVCNWQCEIHITRVVFEHRESAVVASYLQLFGLYPKHYDRYQSFPELHAWGFAQSSMKMESSRYSVGILPRKRGGNLPKWAVRSEMTINVELTLYCL